ncbi:hypothetical protein [Streptomyces galilaeus]|uniref:hypothetical protein n=1 Tax=Streptomyces galilaeus TaxID=33899 RepID=UPI0038F5D837
MARKMNKAPSHAWRAVIVWRTRDSDTETTEYLGPYWRKNDATGRVTTFRNAYRSAHSYRQFVNGWVEAAPLGDWKEA